MSVLLVCLVAASYMAGVSWFVGIVHYPLFAGVGAGDWRAYHRRHSDRTKVVVAVPMVVELLASAALAVDRPPGVGAVAAAAGLAAATATWALTAQAARLHRRIGDSLGPGTHRSLLVLHHARTALWTAHAVLIAAMVAQAAASG